MAGNSGEGFDGFSSYFVQEKGRKSERKKKETEEVKVR